MNFTLNSIFKRDQLTSTKEIIIWWFKGIGLLNLFYLLYTIFHLTILALVFHYVWFSYLIPIIIILWFIINIFYFSGLLFEILLSRIFNLKIDFDTLAPKIKEWLIIISVMTIIFLSIYHIIYK